MLRASAPGGSPGTARPFAERGCVEPSTDTAPRLPALFARAEGGGRGARGGVPGRWPPLTYGGPLAYAPPMVRTAYEKPIRTRPPTKEYCEGWDRVFGQRWAGFGEIVRPRPKPVKK